MSAGARIHEFLYKVWSVNKLPTVGLLTLHREGLMGMSFQLTGGLKRLVKGFGLLVGYMELSGFLCGFRGHLFAIGVLKASHIEAGLSAILVD